MRELLPVVESFHSLQGEGAHAGRSAFFIRLALCNVGCPWCDTKKSWKVGNHPQEHLTTLATNTAKAKHNGAAFVVITGGEPLHHNLTGLCKCIRETTKNKSNKSIPIHIETSGVDVMTGNPDWVTLSPKSHAPPKEDILKCCDELKVIIHEPKDLTFAENMAQEIKINSKKNVLLFMQPGWGNKKGEALAYEYVRNNPQWKLSMQTHKWLGIR
tara:strand:- start:505 stop:1146 length:642 start_codon:yes stop_codon:yes gene_type:complete